MSGALRCSFCNKAQNTVGKLIASATSDPPRAHICDECIAVCNSILEDYEEVGDDEPSADASPKARFVDHPLAAEFLTAAESWAIRGCPVGHASNLLNDLRNLAIRMLAEDTQPAP
jgi:hypothetical protein